MTANLINKTAGVVHVRFAGRSFDVATASLGVGPLSSDLDVKRALARHLEVDAARLSDCVVDRHANGNLTVRPEAVFG
jgi:hypothetical protein